MWFSLFLFVTIPGALVKTPLFDGDESYIAYPPLTNIHYDLRIEMEFKPMFSDGLMFFSGGKKMKVEDFVTLSMVDGHVEFRYELGTGERSDDQIMMYSLQKFYLFIKKCCACASWSYEETSVISVLLA